MLMIFAEAQSVDHRCKFGSLNCACKKFSEPCIKNPRVKKVFNQGVSQFTYRASKTNIHLKELR